MRIVLNPIASEWIRRGYDPAEREIEINPAEMISARETLAEHLQQRDDGGWCVLGAPWPNRGRLPISVEAPTLEAILEAIRADRNAAGEARRQHEERDRRAKERIRGETMAVLRDRRTTEATYRVGQAEPDGGVYSWYIHISKPIVVRSTYTRIDANWPTPSDESVRESPEAKAWLEELERENERRRRAAEELLPALWRERAENERRRREGLEQLKSWASDHGSARLRLLLEEDHLGWRKLARKEWLRAHTPAYYRQVDYGQEELDRTVPTVRDIEILREARKLAEEREWLSDPRLFYLRWFRPATEEEREEGQADRDGEMPESAAAVRLTVTSPTGRCIEVYRWTD